jgi:hypothetical protein
MVVISFAKSRRTSVTVSGMSPGSAARRRIGGKAVLYGD